MIPFVSRVKVCLGYGPEIMAQEKQKYYAVAGPSTLFFSSTGNQK
jgi:hypothetical protein